MKTYIIDLDGTMYSGGTNIDGAREFIDYLHSKNLPYIFLTNNATRTKKQAKKHMLNLGFKDIKEEDFFTSAMATAQYIAKNYTEKKCFMLGESGLEEALKECNLELIQENANFVVVGLDRNATYKKYSEALHHILKGAKFIATNPDRLLANNETFDIGNGAVIDMLEYASGVEAVKIGKPYQTILNILLEEKKLKKEDIILLGDNLETDIKLGYDAKIETIMVCSGVHTEKDIARLKVYPTRVVKNLRELIK
ncbi:HAD-IIA family hydrolase [Fusobacterium nucleatum]|uniref:HAD-IIA family hydrolase n=1 Tax=Fusobacterium nucleatum TaxID=851 RepID=UPI0030CDF5E7